MRLVDRSLESRELTKDHAHDIFYLMRTSFVNMLRGMLHMVVLLAMFFEHSLSVDYVHLELEGDVLYELSWAGSSSAARAEGIVVSPSLDEGAVCMHWVSL